VNVSPGIGSWPLGLDLAIAADVRVAAVFARHQAATRRRADRRARVSLRELRAFGGEPIDVRRLDQLLAERPDIAVAEIVGENEDHIRLRRRGGKTDRGRGQQQNEGEERGGFHRAGKQRDNVEAERYGQGRPESSR
jgi:hypothetical protein